MHNIVATAQSGAMNPPTGHRIAGLALEDHLAARRILPAVKQRNAHTHIVGPARPTLAGDIVIVRMAGTLDRIAYHEAEHQSAEDGAAPTANIGLKSSEEEPGGAMCPASGWSNTTRTRKRA